MIKTIFGALRENISQRLVLAKMRSASEKDRQEAFDALTRMQSGNGLRALIRCLQSLGLELTTDTVVQGISLADQRCAGGASMEDASVPVLIAALSAGAEPVRSLAANFLGYIGDRAATIPLTKLWADSAIVRQSAIAALVQLDDLSTVESQFNVAELEAQATLSGEVTTRFETTTHTDYFQCDSPRCCELHEYATTYENEVQVEMPDYSQQRKIANAQLTFLDAVRKLTNRGKDPITD